MMFRTIFNTYFIKSNILIIVTKLIHCRMLRINFQKTSGAEVLFLEMDLAASVVPVNFSCFEKKDGLPVEAFAKVQEIINRANWLNQKVDPAGNTLQQLTEPNLILEKLGTRPEIIATNNLIDQATSEKPQEKARTYGTIK